MKRKLIISCFLLIVVCSAGVNSQERNTALEIGKKKLFYGKARESIVFFEKALNHYQIEKNYVKVAESHNRLSEAYRSLFNEEEALFHAEEALRISQKKAFDKREEANALDNKGLVYSMMRDIDKSLTFHKEALQIRTNFFPKDSLLQAISFYYLGDRLLQKAKYEEALNLLDKALKIDVTKTPKSTILKANINESIGYIFYDQGKHKKTLRHFEETLKLTQEVFEENHIYFSKVYNQLGLVYSFREQLNESLMYYQKSLSISINNYGIDKHPSQAKIHFNIGTIYQKQGLKEKALYHTRKTLDLGIKMLGVAHEDLYYPYSQMGQIYGDEKGIPYIEKALAIYKGKVDENPIRVSYLHEYLSVIYFKINDYNKALKHAKGALKIRVRAFGEDNTHSIRTCNIISKLYIALKDYNQALVYNERALDANQLNRLDEDLLLESIKIKADVYFKRYGQSNTIAYLKESVELYKRAVTLINSARKRKRNYDDKIQFSETVKSVYARNIETSLMLNKLDRSNSLDSAFYYSEKSKANVLGELMRSTEAKESSNIPKEVLEIENSIDIQVARLNSEILKEITDKRKDSLRIYELEGKLLDITRRKDSLEKRIEVDFPVYHKLKYESSIIQISEIQASLDRETTLIEFFKSNDMVYAFVVSKDSFSVKELLIKELDQKIQELNKSIIDKDQSSFSKRSFELYQLLIKPLEGDFRGESLVIIPDESLWHLQFDLLITKEKIDENKSYLLYDYAISYGNSATLFFENSKGKNRVEVKDECIAFSYSNDGDLKNSNTISLQKLRNSKVDLPGTRKEILEISKLFEGTYFYGKNANEENFKDNANQYKLVHLALHGEIDHMNPKNSKIYFTDSKEESTEDNALYGHELYALKIPADLVVLSACNTGSGKVNKGEGILSLGNAFQYAGAESLLLSRWEISDKTTPEIIKNFYQNLAQGMAKNKALQNAKIQFLEKSDTFQSAPFYWGSFYLLGNVDAIPIQTSNTNSILIFLLLLVGLILIVLVKRVITKQKL